MQSSKFGQTSVDWFTRGNNFASFTTVLQAGRLEGTEDINNWVNNIEAS